VSVAQEPDTEATADESDSHNSHVERPETEPVCSPERWHLATMSRSMWWASGVSLLVQIAMIIGI